MAPAKGAIARCCHQKSELPNRLITNPAGVKIVVATSQTRHGFPLRRTRSRVQVRVFSDCEMRWFYQHLLAVPDPPTVSMALDGLMPFSAKVIRVAMRSVEGGPESEIKRFQMGSGLLR